MNSDESEQLSSGWPSLTGAGVVLCLLISLAGICDHDLWTPDEPREAALALSMSRTGNIVIPQLAGEPFVEKPPLYYIVASLGISMGGQWLGPTAALRLTSALWGLGTLGMTCLLARRIWHPQAGGLAVVVLAMMPGFVQVTHWILVDNALMFFVVAACWCLAEAYREQRWSFLPLAGAFAAGAFLSKGLIGPIIIALGGVGLIVPLVRQYGWSRLFAIRSLVFHGCALLLLLVLAGAWMLALRQTGGVELWHEWFWNNHLGRFTGQASALGHRAWFGYYLEILPLYLLPWIAVWLVGLGRALRRWQRKEPVNRAWIFLLCWGLGGLALLTLSSTKREIYLSVLLPAFALMVVPALREPLSAWTRYSLKIWKGLALLAMAAMIFAPIVGIRYGMPALERACYMGLAILLFGIALAAVMRRDMPWLQQWVLIAALAYISVLTVLCPLVDRVKSYGPAFREMSRRVTRDPNAGVAAWMFDETSRAGFYYYSDIVFPSVTNMADLQCILKGGHPRFNSILALSRRFPPKDVALPPWKMLWEERMGPRRSLLWITGNPPRPIPAPPAERYSPP